jgi:hypothetical protein
MTRLWQATAVVVGALALAAPAAGNTLKPTRHDDPPPGRCKPHDCSLREAVIAANEHAGPHTLELGRGHYRLEIPEDASDPLRSGDLNLITDTVVRGEGPRKTSVDGQGLTRVFGLLSGFQTLHGLTVERGAGVAQGAGILTGNENTSLENVVVKFNAAISDGGAVYSAARELTIVHSAITKNAAAGRGAGLFMGANPPAFGAAHATIRASTFSHNNAGLGGAISLDGLNTAGSTEEPRLDVLNSTFAANGAAGSGGGISAVQGAVAAVDNSTIAYNGADIDNSDGGLGGGLQQSSGADFHLDDSIIAANTVGSSGMYSQCSGTFPGAGNLLAPNNDGCGATFLYVADAIIGGLADNGGPTRTIAVLAGSRAIGLSQSCPKRDQRGVRRPLTECDAGAFERARP